MPDRILLALWEKYANRDNFLPVDTRIAYGKAYENHHSFIHAAPCWQYPVLPLILSFEDATFK